MQWYIDKNEFPSLMIIRRYLKLIYSFCLNNDLMNEDIEKLINKDLPFNISLVPIKFPKPDTLVLTIN
jgi:hypothetical protein